MNIVLILLLVGDAFSVILLPSVNSMKIITTGMLNVSLLVKNKLFFKLFCNLVIRFLLAGRIWHALLEIIFCIILLKEKGYKFQAKEAIDINI